MMYTVDADEYNWLEYLFDEMFRTLMKPDHHGTQKAQAQRAGVHEGTMEGVTAALVAIGTEQRIARINNTIGQLPKEHVPMVDIFQVSDWIHKEGKAAIAGERAFHEEGEREKWIEYISETFAELVWPDSLVEEYSKIRRELILDGKLAPDFRDYEWLQEHVESLKPTMEKVNTLIEQAAKAAGKKKK